MDIGEILGTITEATNSLRAIATKVDEAGEVLSSSEKAQIDGAIQSLTEETNRLQGIVDRKLATASKA